MHVLGSFIGTYEFMHAEALAHVEGVGASSINSATATVALLAGSKARNPRAITGMLLRVCVVSKVSYMCRTIRPDLFLASARRVGVLLEGAFCTIYNMRRDIFAAGATAEHRLAVARVHLPTALRCAGAPHARLCPQARFQRQHVTRCGGQGHGAPQVVLPG
jgi:hypothetical protein